MNDKFIPIVVPALLQTLSQQGSAISPEFVRLLKLWRHQSHYQNLQHLIEAYLPFSPDRDTKQVLEFNGEQKQGLKTDLIAGLSNAVESANYQAISQQQLEDILNDQSPYGLELKVDLAEYEDILLYARGEGLEYLDYRHWKDAFLKKRQYQLETFKRLFILVKLKDEVVRIKEIMAAEGISETKAAKKLKKYRAALPGEMDCDHIYLKLFKDVPKADLEMLFPTTRIALKTFDKLKLGVTAGGGTGASVVATATKVAATSNPVTLATAIGGLAAVIFRQVSKVITQRNKYMMLMAQKLYFHNLANNRGVLTLLADRAEEEDIKEMLLLYHFQQQQPGKSPEFYQQAIEEFLNVEFEVDIDFDIEDAQGQLAELGLQPDAAPEAQLKQKLAATLNI